MIENNSVLQDQKEEEALSLCDLPLDENHTECEEMTNNKHTSSSSSSSIRMNTTSTTRRSSSEPAELFSFLSSSENIMCPAEDMIFCGRLISSSKPIKTLSTDDKKLQPPTFRRRSESLSELQSTSTTRSNSTKTSKNNILRSSRSLDYQKLRRFSITKNSPDSDMDRNPSLRRPDKLKAVKPRWYLFMFGMVKFPPEMDLQDIKSRQFRRNSSSVLFPPSESDGNFPDHQGSGKSSWKLLKALSCKDHSSIAVATSFYVPQV
ncbi:hypothetical protein Dsin_008412 [Dipteronia sinensis]|uniref:Uncharacterized protein n=1 Tax=Dipteronia sinensis TaxID=43782 RepID=A0AAE0ANY4_9ROSI|nr:hypothetical protein Dsin_008412 [Dipteronia sinensis]